METHAFPGFGDDAQAVINDEIPDDFDLFIGIMWCRFGTETNRAGSGTVEEFERAKARFDAEPASVRLMLYFKDAPIAPSQVDPSQLAKIVDFKAMIGREGGLYSSFSTLEQFEKLIRSHLSRQVQAWLGEHKTSERPVVEPPASTPVVDKDNLALLDPDDDGILDLMEIFEDRFGELKEISLRIGEATEELGATTTVRTTEINRLTAKSKGNVSPNVAKRLMGRVAGNMNQYVARMEAELPAFGNAVSEGFNSFVKAMSMSLDDEMENRSQADIDGAMRAVTEMRSAITSSENSTVEFRDSVAQLPRLTKPVPR